MIYKIVDNAAIIKPFYKGSLLSTVYHDIVQSSAPIRNELTKITIWSNIFFKLEDLVENSMKIFLGEFNAEITKYMYLENAQKISLPYYTLVINLMCYISKQNLYSIENLTLPLKKPGWKSQMDFKF